MELKPGYKQTELGVIPEEWEVLRLKEIISKLQLGGNYPNRETCAGPPLIKMGNIGRGAISLEKIEYISDADTLRIVDRLSYGDVLFNTRNTLELVGKVAIWRNELPLAYFNSNIMKITFDDEIVSSNEYANYLFNSYITIRQLRDVATGTTSVAAIYTRDLLKISFVICPAVEQIKIARTLSDIDSFITSFEKLIEKKKLILQGVMQELLTGKRRLPGFSGEWETKRLGDVCIIRKGQTITQKDVVDGPYPVIAGGKTPAYFHNSYNRNSKTITISASGAYAGFVGFHKRPIFASDCSTLEPIEDVIVEFIYYWLENHQSGLYDLQTGGAQPHVYPQDISKILVSYPNDRFEQKEIISILISISEEISLLKSKHMKTTYLKQTMMQDLLTGRIRLI